MINFYQFFMNIHELVHMDTSDFIFDYPSLIIDITQTYSE
jgi:hypothetical protein